MENRRSCFRALLHLVMLHMILPSVVSSCGRERCCGVEPCTTLYCNQMNSETWVSTQNFADYQFTKLVMQDNQCMPCPNNCQSCTTTSSCGDCYDGYYLSGEGMCELCDYQCLSCILVNGISKCSRCDTGTYLSTTSATCQACPAGASQCASSTAVISCLNGYQKSSNSLFCTACPSNCLSCPLNTAYCSVCNAGYFMSAGICNLCTASNCNTCIGVGANIYCTQCKSGYILAAGICKSCPSQCTTCSSLTKCTTCKSGFYATSSGSCSPSSAINNCLTYSSASACSVCSSGYYLSASTNSCYPCSILCSTCTGPHFGSCSVCSFYASLFNQMCIVNPYPSSSTYLKYIAQPADQALFSGGSPSCGNLLYSGQSISLALDNLAGFKIMLDYKIYTAGPAQVYSVSLNDAASAQTSSSTSYQVCTTGGALFVHRQQTVTFSNIKLENRLVFSSSSTLHLSEMVITVQRCNDLCLECSESECFTCLNDNLYAQGPDCVYACGTGYYIYEEERKCVSDCPIGTFALLTNVSCMACVGPCATCLSESYCLSCLEAFFLTADHTCVEVCPYQFYGSATTSQCEECVGRCNECTSEEECLNCQLGFLEGTNCVDHCAQVGYYTDLETLECEPCSPECQECEYLSTFCLSCSSSLVFYNNTCLTTCPDATFSDGITCQACTYPCEHCSSATLCLTCIDSYLMDSACVSPCPDAYYEDNLALTCQPCSPACSICYSSPTNCLQCVSSYYWVDYQCVLDCPDTFYPDTYSAGLGICTPCSNLCYTCLNQTFCLSCTSNFLNIPTGQCVRASGCPQHYYADITTLTCAPCSTPCSTCELAADHCTSCLNSLILHDSACVASCPSVFYFNSSSKCSLCVSPCLTCLDESQCLSCLPGYKYSSVTNVCSSTCSISTFFDPDISDCQACSSNCLTCSSPTFCFTCQQNYYLLITDASANQCVLTCPDGYFPDAYSCMLCLYPCTTCTSSIDCLTCAYGVQYQSRCLAGCPDSTYTNGDVCDPCQGNCLSCKDAPTTCISCKDPYYLHGDTCVVTCPLGSYSMQVTKQCVECPSSCSQCTNATHCTSCISGDTYLNPTTFACIDFCPSGQYGSDATGQCESCQPKCLTCLHAADNCQSCSSAYLLVELDNAEFDCMLDCPVKYYSDNSLCYRCTFPCSTCDSAVACLTCAPGMFFHSASSSCLLSCPLGTFYDTDTCEECVEPCETCMNVSTCVSCVGEKLLHAGTCVDECPAQFYPDNSGMCNQCYGLCKTCSGKYYCLTCFSGFAYDGFCYSACPPGTYAQQDTKTCQPCDSPCLECAVLPDYCKKCQFGWFAYKGSCQDACPTGTYQSGDVCEACLFPCIDCADQFSCRECIGGYLLYMNASCIPNVEKCPNDLYKMDSKECVPFTWCPSNYFKDETLKTCSAQCSRDKYVDSSTRTCTDACELGQYVGQGMECISWVNQKPTSLMAMTVLAFIRSSQMHIVVTFNESASWDESGSHLFTIYDNDLSRRMLQVSSLSTIPYDVDYSNSLNPMESDLALQITAMPYSVDVYLPAYYIHSQVSGYPLQTPQVQKSLPPYAAYSYSDVQTGSMMRDFSEGVSWFIILFSLFFLFLNRLSDVYIIWDTAQLLYLLLFLNIQYPPNLNEFLAGMSNTHFLFVPSLFKGISALRFASNLPFYAYSYDCSFLRTAGSPLLLLLIVLIFFLLLKLLELLNSKWQAFKAKFADYPNFKRFVFRGILRFRWHHTSDAFFLSYDIIMLFAIAELSKISANPNNLISNAVAALFIVLYVVFPFFVGYKLSKHYDNIAKGKHVSNLQCFYRGIDKSSKFGVALILLRYFRKIIYCAIIGLFSMEPMFALPILMFTSVLLGLFIIINKPFKKRLSNIITFITELILVIVFCLVALINFDVGFDLKVNWALGWICCLLLILMIFALIFEVFCKTMFYLEPQDRKGGSLDKGKFSEEYLRQKAGEFFEFIFPKLKERLNLDDSEDEFLDYEDGDSDNSENNKEREKNWGIDSEDSEKRSDEFRHYGGEESESAATEAKDSKKKPPNYLIRCVKELE